MTKNDRERQERWAQPAEAVVVLKRAADDWRRNPPKKVG